MEHLQNTETQSSNPVQPSSSDLMERSEVNASNIQFEQIREQMLPDSVLTPSANIRDGSGTVLPVGDIANRSVDHTVRTTGSSGGATHQRTSESPKGKGYADSKLSETRHQGLTVQPQVNNEMLEQSESYSVKVRSSAAEHAVSGLPVEASVYNYQQNSEEGGYIKSEHCQETKEEGVCEEAGATLVNAEASLDGASLILPQEMSSGREEHEAANQGDPALMISIHYIYNEGSSQFSSLFTGEKPLPYDNCSYGNLNLEEERLPAQDTHHPEDAIQQSANDIQQSHATQQPANAGQQLPHATKQSANAIQRYANPTQQPANSIQQQQNAIQRSANAIQELPNAIQWSANAIQQLPHAFQQSANSIQQLPNAIQQSADVIQQLPHAIHQPADAIQQPEFEEFDGDHFDIDLAQERAERRRAATQASFGHRREYYVDANGNIDLALFRQEWTLKHRCCSCWEGQKEVQILPCGHSVLCWRCFSEASNIGQRLQRCPRCMQPVADIRPTPERLPLLVQVNGEEWVPGKMASGR